MVLGRGLLDLPPDIPPDVIHLYLSNNQLSDIDYVTHYAATLVSLDVSDNPMVGSHLNNGTFVGMQLAYLNLRKTGYTGSLIPKDILQPVGRTLTALSMEQNSLVNISCSELEVFYLLEELDFSVNHIKYLGNMSCLATTLKLLDLENNQLIDFDINTFQNFFHLEILNLNQNSELSRLPVLSSSLKSLTRLEMSHTKLSVIPVDYFQLYIRLSTLNFQSTHIVEIPDMRWSASGMITLKVANAELEYLDRDIICAMFGKVNSSYTIQEFCIF